MTTEADRLERRAIELGGCPCWVGHYFHEGAHCCFRGLPDDYDTLPCGHDPRDPQPDLFGEVAE